MSEFITLKTDILSINEEIKDFIDENQVMSICEKDIEDAISSMMQLRTSFRKNMIEIKTKFQQEYDEEFNSICINTLIDVKNYLKYIRDHKIQMNMKEVQYQADVDIQKEKSMVFIAEDVERSLTQLEYTYSQDINSLGNEELLNLKSEVDANDKKFQELLTFTTNNKPFLAAIADIDERYRQLTSLKETFENSVRKLNENRELNKHSLFNESKLNIQLNKFKGYDSRTDIYTFKSNFEKIYLRTTPEKLLPDLLIKNFLEEPALSLIKGVTNIIEI